MRTLASRYTTPILQDDLGHANVCCCACHCSTDPGADTADTGFLSLVVKRTAGVFRYENVLFLWGGLSFLPLTGHLTLVGVIAKSYVYLFSTQFSIANSLPYFV